MPWYWDSDKHAAIFATGSQAAVLNVQVFSGAHDMFPGQRWYGPYDSQAAAQAAGATLPSSSLPGVDTSGVTGPIINAVPQVEGYFVRGLEAIAGIVIMAIAFNAIIRASTGVDVGRSVRSGARKATAAALA